MRSGVYSPPGPTTGASHIVFVVRASGGSDLLAQTSDTTWQAYNLYGGYKPTSGPPACARSQLQPPFTTRGGDQEDWLFTAEYPMIRWLERNGYDVSYTTDLDTGLRPAELLEHQAFLSVGHDEYWSQEQRERGGRARCRRGSRVLQRERDLLEDPHGGLDAGSGDDRRTMVVYKEGTAAPSGADEHRRCYADFTCDPSDVWTGLWRESPLSTAGNSVVGEPENALSGQISWRSNTTSIEVPGDFARMRFWRNTAVSALSPSGRVTLANGTLGYEWNPEYPQYANWYPPGRVLLSNTTIASEQHHLSLYRAPSGALVFGAGTVQWSWGLDGEHDGGNSTEDRNVQQATVNLLADMGAQPGTLQSGLVAASASTDATAPSVVITSSAASVTGPGTRTVSGSAADAGGGVVGTVEVSTDGGSTWRRATGRESWSHTFTAPAGTPRSGCAPPTTAPT